MLNKNDLFFIEQDGLTITHPMISSSGYALLDSASFNEPTHECVVCFKWISDNYNKPVFGFIMTVKDYIAAIDSNRLVKIEENYEYEEDTVEYKLKKLSLRSSFALFLADYKAKNYWNNKKTK